MNDTNSFAMRIVAGGEAFMRKAPKATRWEISGYRRTLNLDATTTDRILYCQEMQHHPIFDRTFATPDEAARALHRIVAY